MHDGEIVGDLKWYLFIYLKINIYVYVYKFAFSRFTLTPFSVFKAVSYKLSALFRKLRWNEECKGTSCYQNVSITVNGRQRGYYRQWEQG